MGILAKWARTRLLGRCESGHAALLGRDDGYDGSTEEIREGLRAAKEVIRRVEPAGGLRAYLDAVDQELLREQGKLTTPREEDRTTAGIAEIRMELGRIPRRLAWEVVLALMSVGLIALLLGLLVTR
jgi:hypothetical protein